MIELTEQTGIAVRNWRRMLYVAFAAQVLALLGFKFVWPFLPLYLQTLGVRGQAVPLWAGIIEFSEELPMALAAPFWGMLGDRYGRKIMVVRAMGSGALIVSLLIIAPNVWAVLALMILSGILTGVISPLHALVASALPRDKIGFGMGLMQSGIFIASAFGPLIGGFFNDHLGFHGAFVIGAGMLVLSTLLVIYFMHEQFDQPQPTPGRAGFNLFADLRAVALIPGLLVMALVIAIIYFGNLVPYPVLPLFVPQFGDVPRINGEPQVSTMVGMIFAVTGICSTLAAWQTHRITDRYGYRRVLVGAMVLAGLMYASVFFAQSVWHLMLVRAVVGLCFGAALPITSALIALITPEDRRASAYGLTASLQSFGTAAGPLLGGAVGAAFGLRAVFPLATVVLVMVAVVVALNVREPAAQRSF